MEEDRLRVKDFNPPCTLSTVCTWLCTWRLCVSLSSLEKLGELVPVSQSCLEEKKHPVYAATSAAGAVLNVACNPAWKKVFSPFPLVDFYCANKNPSAPRSWRPCIPLSLSDLGGCPEVAVSGVRNPDICSLQAEAVWGSEMSLKVRVQLFHKQLCYHLCY